MVPISSSLYYEIRLGVTGGLLSSARGQMQEKVGGRSLYGCNPLISPSVHFFPFQWKKKRTCTQTWSPRAWMTTLSVNTGKSGAPLWRCFTTLLQFLRNTSSPSSFSSSTSPSSVVCLHPLLPTLRLTFSSAWKKDEPAWAKFTRSLKLPPVSDVTSGPSKKLCDNPSVDPHRSPSDAVLPSRVAVVVVSLPPSSHKPPSTPLAVVFLFVAASSQRRVCFLSGW